jgi:hypothetical protein
VNLAVYISSVDAVELSGNMKTSKEGFGQNGVVLFMKFAISCGKTFRWAKNAIIRDNNINVFRAYCCLCQFLGRIMLRNSECLASFEE